MNKYLRWIVLAVAVIGNVEAAESGEIVPMVMHPIKPDDIVALISGDKTINMSKLTSDKIVELLKGRRGNYIVAESKDDYLVEIEGNRRNTSRIIKPELRKPTYALILKSKEEPISKIPRIIAWLDDRMNAYHFSFRDVYDDESKAAIKSLLPK